MKSHLIVILIFLLSALFFALKNSPYSLLQKKHLKQNVIENSIQNLQQVNLKQAYAQIIKCWNEGCLNQYNVVLNSSYSNITLLDFKNQNANILDIVTKDIQQNQIQVLLIFENNLSIGEALIILQSEYQNLFNLIIYVDSFYSYFEFIKENQQIPGTVGFTIIQNSQKVIDINGNHFMGLQGMEKSMTILEFAIQVGEGKLQLNQLVNISEIEKFRSPCAYEEFGYSYQPIPVDSSNKMNQYLSAEGYNAQVGFWNYTHQLLNNTLVTLEDIALAITNFTSRPCTEFLQGLVGIDNINAEIQTLKMNHTKNLTYINSMEYAFTNYDNMPEDQYLNYVQHLTYNQMLQEASIIHEALAQSINNKYFTSCLDNDEAFNLFISPQILYPSCSNDYASVFQKINEGNYFNQQTEQLLLDFFGIQFPNNQFYGHKFEKIGWKDGVGDLDENNNMLTFGLYFTDLEGNTVNFVLFLNKLQRVDFEKLFNTQIHFNLAFSTSQLYLKNLIKQLQDS